MQQFYFILGSKCEILEVSQCRDLHHSYAVEAGSQLDEKLPRFPDASTVLPLTINWNQRWGTYY